MLLDRLFEPNDQDILYHYCSAASFQAIVESKRIRFSDINMLNDAEEMRWGYHIFEKAAGELLRLAASNPQLKYLDKAFLDKIDEIISPMQFFVHPFVASFSKEPDMLSQWRAYAEDACGFAIGFSGLALKNMPVTLLTVEYEPERQLEEMKTVIGACYLGSCLAYR
jgi:hypothetical protein